MSTNPKRYSMSGKDREGIKIPMGPCSVCGGELQPKTPVEIDNGGSHSHPRFQCLRCNITFQITNPSYLPIRTVRMYYDAVQWFLLTKSSCVPPENSDGT